ncbi:hypothetical protein ACU21_06450 [Actinobaculum suis]|nr:hypothetical protein ACU19_07480 [Actinobaculum suis]OCA94265.1 hypothetical protein ACU20_07070 [Actinobaculum suis]OCA94520.1 hypothetical protein ACU21_06450 [Actinobaculum suis]
MITPYLAHGVRHQAADAAKDAASPARPPLIALLPTIFMIVSAACFHSLFSILHLMHMLKKTAKNTQILLQQWRPLPPICDQFSV